MSHLLVWLITAGALLGILIRPKGWPEAVWACLGAALLLAFGLVSWSQAWTAVGRGTDVYLFLTGMMLLAELARREGVFDWLAGHAVDLAKGSPSRLFLVVYGVGILVTTFLCNDATAVVLTPAVYAAVKKARATPLPYLLICAFIANAASFVLPISNPANLVLYGQKLPPLLPWLRTFALPSILSITATYAALHYLCRKDLTQNIASDIERSELSTAGRRAALGILAAGAVLIVASAFGKDLGLPTCLAALAVLLAVTYKDRSALLGAPRDVSWSVLPLVAGLFILVEAIEQAGALTAAGWMLTLIETWNAPAGVLSAAFSVGILSNIMNNLPVGLLTGGLLLHQPVQPLLRDALLIGVDLGPNLSVTGSLATILWLVALRREGQHIGAWQFLRYGLLVMPPALTLAALGLLWP